MNEITIYNASGATLMTVPVTANAQHEEVLMQSDSVLLKWNAATSTVLPSGAFVVLNSIRYYLAEDYQPDSKDLGEYTYTPTFVHEVYLLSKMPFLLINATNSGNSVESDWNYTGSLADLASTLENAIYDAIGVAYSIDIDESIENAVSLSFSNVSILTALNDIASNLECEWYTDEAINGYTGDKIIHFAPTCLHEGGEGQTLSLTAGEQVGFPSSKNRHEFYNRYYIFGATRNIPQDYNGAQANMVVNKRLTLDPTIHPNGYIDLPMFTEEGEIVEGRSADGDPAYYKDKNGTLGYYVPDPSLSDRIFTKVVHIESVYPRANLKVGSIVKQKCYVRDDNDQKVEIGTDSGGNPVYSMYYVYYISLLTDGDQPFTINSSTYDAEENPDGSLIKGQTLSLHFKSGALTGREFTCTYHDTATTKKHEDGSGTINVPAGAFEIVFIEDNTVIIPNDNIEPDVDDELTVFNIRMPQAYVQSAYYELETEALKAIYEDWRDSNEYEVSSNQVDFVSHAYNLHIGRHVKFHAWGRLIDTRCVKLTTKLDRPFEQTIAFSKALKKGTITTLLTTIEATSARMTKVELKDESNLRKVRQQLYTAQRETYEAMFDTDGYFTAPISPVTLQTQMIAIGAKSTNFTLGNVIMYPNKNAAGTAKDVNHVSVVSTNGKLVHYGLGTTPRTWNVNSSEVALSDSGLYYIYARCTKAEGTTACDIVFDQTQRQFDSDTTYYYFLMGTISSVIDGDRVISTTYGSTNISGNHIQTGRIQSLDGNTYFDLDTGELRGNFTFTSAQKDELAADAASRVQVGGRNLVRETYSGNIYTPKTVTLTTANSYPFVTSHPSSNKGFTVSTDTQYTLSFWIKTDGNITKLTINIWNTVTIAKAINNVMPVDGSFTAETWQKVVCTFYPSQTVSNNGIMVKGEVASGDTDTHTYYVKEIKLEKGTIATDWTAAPEDVDEGIAAAQAAADDAQEAADNAQTAANTANSTISLMDGNTTFSIIEKKAFRPQWKEISGYDNTTSTPTTSTSVGGSYEKALKAASGTSVSTSALTTAFGNLRTYLNSMALWTNSNTTGFSQSTLGTYTKTYYDAETALYNALADYYAQQVATDNGNRNILHGSRSFEFSTASNWKLGTWRASGGGSGTRTRILASDSSYPTNTPVATDVWQIGATTASTGETSVCQQLITAMEVGEKYTLSCYARAISGSPLLYIQLNGGANGGQTIKPSITTEWVRYSLTVTHTTAQANAGGGVIYVGHYSSIGVLQICGLKLEKGTKATDWCPNDADTDYLTSALAEASATFNSTTINGGLVLSKFIGVRDSSNNVVAGMHGTGANMPMIFAGVSSSNAQGTFRVWKDGKIQSTNAAATQHAQLNNAALDFYQSGNLKTRVTAESMGTQGISTAVDSQSTSIDGVVTNVEIDLGSSASIRHEDTSSAFETDTDTAKSFSQTYTLLEAQQYTGTFKTDVALTINMLANWNTGDGHTFISGGTISVTAKLLVGSTVKVTASDSITVDLSQSSSLSSKSVTIPIQNFTLSSGTAVTLQVTASITALNVQAVDLSYTYQGSASMSVHTNTTINPTFVASFYKDNIYSDGLLMSSFGNMYFGIDPQMRDGSLFRAMGGANNGLRLTDNGLAFQQGSSSWYRLNPLALIVRLTYANGLYTGNALYNPRNLTVKADRQSTGLIKVSLNIGHTSYSVLGSGINESNGVFVSSYNRTADYFFVELVSGTTRRDWNADIMVYDYSTI